MDLVKGENGQLVMPKFNIDDNNQSIDFATASMIDVVAFAGDKLPCETIEEKIAYLNDLSVADFEAISKPAMAIVYPPKDEEAKKA